MRLYRLELKRVLTTKRTWILFMLALLFSVITAYIPVTFQYTQRIDEKGNVTQLKGLDAIHDIRKQSEAINGTVTDQKIEKVIEQYQEYFKEYEKESIYTLPAEVSYKMKPYQPFAELVLRTYENPVTNTGPDLLKLNSAKVGKFYQQYPKFFTERLKIKQSGFPSAQKQATNMFHKIKLPLTYYYGLNIEAFEYQSILIFLIAIFSVVIVAPIFSSDYQTGADDIQRCTKYGRLCFGIVKVLSALTICIVLFSLCLLISTLITNSLFGWESTKTSVQMLHSPFTLLSINAGQLEWLNSIASLLSLLSLIAFTLFLSSRIESTVSSLSLALICCFGPMILNYIIPNTFGDWIRALFPGGGIGFQTSMLYTLLEQKFLHIGNISIWDAYMMIGASIIEIVLFLVLAVVSYCRKHA